MPEFLLIEFIKIFNWTEKTPQVRLHISWLDSKQLLLEKMVKGEVQEESLKFKLPLKVEITRTRQNLRIQLFNSLKRQIGTAELSLEYGMTKQKVHYLSIPNSQNKILQVNVSVDSIARSQSNKDISFQCERVVQETMERKVIANIELKRNDQFIKNRQKFLTDYSRSRSKSRSSIQQNFPSKINSLLQQVRQIKNAIKLSSSRSSSRVGTQESNNTPSRLTGLQSIDERPRLLQRSPKELPKRSPRRFESDNRCKFVPVSPDLYSEYGIMKSKFPEQRPSDRPRQRPNDRPSYLIRKNYS